MFEEEFGENKKFFHKVVTKESMHKQTSVFNDLNSPVDSKKSTANEIVVKELSIVSSGKAFNCQTVVVTDKTGASREFLLMQVSFLANNSMNCVDLNITVA